MIRSLVLLLLASIPAYAGTKAGPVNTLPQWLMKQRIRLAFPAVPPPTLREQAARASVVLHGTLANPAMNPAGGANTAVTDLHILTVVKSHPALDNRKVVFLPRFIPVPDPKKPPRAIAFFDVNEGNLVLSTVMLIDSDVRVIYLLDAEKLDPKKPGEALLYFHRHFDHDDAEIARDARRWLRALGPKDLPAYATTLPPDTIAAYLKNERSPYWLLDIDAILLGYCGKDRHATLLRSMIDDKRESKGPAAMEGLLIGYTLLRPKEGLTLLREIAGERESHVRGECLGALQFFREKRPDALQRGQLVETVCLMLAQPDIAHEAIEELRQLGEESVLERVLALHDRKGFEDVRPAVLQFALTFPNNRKAAEFVEDRRLEDPELVEDAEERLKR